MRVGIGWATASTRPASVVRRHRLNGVEPDAYTASARRKREGDIPDAVLLRATEAGMA